MSQLDNILENLKSCIKQTKEELNHDEKYNHFTIFGIKIT